VYYAVSFLKHEIESIHENLAFHFAREQRGDRREKHAFKPAKNNNQKVNKKNPTNLIFLKLRDF